MSKGEGYRQKSMRGCGNRVDLSDPVIAGQSLNVRRTNPPDENHVSLDSLHRSYLLKEIDVELFRFEGKTDRNVDGAAAGQVSPEDGRDAHGCRDSPIDHVSAEHQ